MMTAVIFLACVAAYFLFGSVIGDFSEKSWQIEGNRSLFAYLMFPVNRANKTCAYGKRLLDAESDDDDAVIDGLHVLGWPIKMTVNAVLLVTVAPVMALKRRSSLKKLLTGDLYRRSAKDLMAIAAVGMNEIKISNHVLASLTAQIDAIEMMSERVDDHDLATEPEFRIDTLFTLIQQLDEEKEWNRRLAEQVNLVNGAIEEHRAMYRLAIESARELNPALPNTCRELLPAREGNNDAGYGLDFD